MFRRRPLSAALAGRDVPIAPTAATGVERVELSVTPLELPGLSESQQQRLAARQMCLDDAQVSGL